MTPNMHFSKAICEPDPQDEAILSQFGCQVALFGLHFLNKEMPNCTRHNLTTPS